MKLGLCAAPIQWRKKTKLKSNQVDLTSVKFQSQRGKAKTVLVENNLSKASFSFRFFHSTKFANGAQLSCDLSEVTLIFGRFVIFKMKFTKIQL